MDVEEDMAKIQCKGKTQKCQSMKTGEQELLAPGDYPGKAGILVALKEHSTLPG